MPTKEEESYTCPNCGAKDKYFFNETSHADKIYESTIKPSGFFVERLLKAPTSINITVKVFRECLSCNGYRTLFSENTKRVTKKDRDNELGKEKKEVRKLNADKNPMVR